MTSIGLVRGIAATAVIGGGALAAAGATGALELPEDAGGALAPIVAGGAIAAGGLVALGTAGRLGAAGRAIGLGGAALVGVGTLAGCSSSTSVSGSGGSSGSGSTSGATPSPTPAPETRPGVAPSTPAGPSPTTGPAPTTGPTDSAAPKTPKEAYEADEALNRARVDTIEEAAAWYGPSETALGKPKYVKIFRQAMNERLTVDVPLTGAVDWKAVATRLDTTGDGKLDYAEREAGGRYRARIVATYAQAVDQLVKDIGQPETPLLRKQAGEYLLKTWSGPVADGQVPGDTYGAAEELLKDAKITRKPDGSADWFKAAEHMERLLGTYARPS